MTDEEVIDNIKMYIEGSNGVSEYVDIPIEVLQLFLDNYESLLRRYIKDD